MIAIACWLMLTATLTAWAFPVPQQQGVSNIVVTDLRIGGDVQDVTAVQARILKNLEGREFDSDSEGLEEIGEVIRAEFQDSGYFRVVLSNLRSEPLDAERHRVLVTVNVEEGEQYRTGDISIVSDPPLLIPEQELRRQIPLNTGDLFNADQLRRGLEGMRRIYGAQGYADMIAEPEFAVDQKHGSIALTLHVHAGEQYHVESFEVRGLDSKTSSLLEAKMRPGSLFNTPLLMDLFNQGKAAKGGDASIDNVVRVKRNTAAATVDVLLDFSATTRPD